MHAVGLDMIGHRQGTLDDFHDLMTGGHELAETTFFSLHAHRRRTNRIRPERGTSQFAMN
jgi:hypothetical protein